MGFVSWGMSAWWINLGRNQRAICLLSIFATLSLAHFMGFGFAEKGVFLSWLPIFLVLYYNPASNKMIYGASGFLLLFSNKISALLSFLSIFVARYKKILIVIFSLGLIGLGVFCFEGEKLFFERSINSRVFIWLSCAKGFLASPIWGHGFKNFALDYPNYKIIGTSWATLASQQISHGHSLLFNYLFELGLVGIMILVLFFYLIYKRALLAFVPLLVLSLIDIPFSFFSEFLLGSLILAPFLLRKNPSEHKLASLLTAKLPQRFKLFAILVLYILALWSFIPSAVGHYYYDQKNYSKAIGWDNKHSLYYFMRGAVTMQANPLQAKSDYEEAIKLSPHIGYFYGYLSLIEIAMNNHQAANTAIQETMRLSGTTAYWNFIAALANFNDEEVYDTYFKKVVAAQPQIFEQACDPEGEASLTIGHSYGDVRIMSFFRGGPLLFLPLPYISECPKYKSQLRQRLIEIDREAQERILKKKRK
jgi:tetratricopeptide (TPR) repeat protein